ncbi:DNA-binding transcriptional regulator YiaG [Roseateles asaccharophilus]|uniref:Aca2/YdiL-like domain-containing protein n=1 Tax=Roseateles asaccharophilus TaxID=582607 RepID=UPI0038353E48
MTKVSDLVARAKRVAQNFGLAPIPNPPASADAMTAAECQALRQALLLTQAEAGLYVSASPVSERAWQYWEAGRRTVPADVAENLRALAKQKADAVDAVIQAASTAPPEPLIAIFYPRVSDWQWTLKDHGTAWKLHNSVVAELAARGLVKIVGFDSEAYAAWSKLLPPATVASEPNRHSAWALSTLQPA